MSDGKKKLLINTDAGIDDAQAILMALKHPDVEVVAITTSHGNTDEAHVCRNVLRLLKVAGRLDIPVYRGASRSLVGDSIREPAYHGSDGFGDVPDPDAPDLSCANPEHAVLAMIRLANQYPGQLILVHLAPSTNVALALRLDPGLGQKFKACYMMGGNYEGKGNTTSSAEFNFHSDPEAAAVVLKELDCPLYLVGWELCLKHILTAKWYETFVDKGTAAAKFIETIERKTITQVYKSSESYVTADQIVMAIVLDHDAVVKDEKLVFCDVETCGIHTRGSMVVTWPQSINGMLTHRDGRRIHLILELNHNVYRDMLFRATD